jgi:hypothetical protein
MARRLFTLLSALSLLLCVAVVVLWVRSVGHFGEAQWAGQAYAIQGSGIDGVCGLLLTRDSMLHPRTREGRLYGWSSWRVSLRPGRDRATLFSPSFNRWGFGFHAEKTVGPPQGGWRFGGRRIWIIYLPFWVPAALLLLPPLLWAGTRARRTLLRRRRRLSGQCVACGYDLKESPQQCPECGAVRPHSKA